MSERIDPKAVEARTYDMTTNELVAAIGLRHGIAVIFTAHPKSEEPGRMPLDVRVVGSVGDAKARLAALRLARASIDFTIVQIEDGNG